MKVVDRKQSLWNKTHHFIEALSTLACGWGEMKIMSPDSFRISFQNIGLLANCCWTKILERMSLVLSYAIGHGSTMSQQGLGKSIPTEPERWTGTSLAIWYVDQYQAHQNSPSPFFCITAELSLKPQAVVDVQWRPSGPVSEWKQINAWVVGESLSYMIFRFRCPLPNAKRILSRLWWTDCCSQVLILRPTCTFIAFLLLCFQVQTKSLLNYCRRDRRSLLFFRVDTYHRNMKIIARENWVCVRRTGISEYGASRRVRQCHALGILAFKVPRSSRLKPRGWSCRVWQIRCKTPGQPCCQHVRRPRSQILSAEERNSILCGVYRVHQRRLVHIQISKPWCR